MRICDVHQVVGKHMCLVISAFIDREDDTNHRCPSERQHMRSFYFVSPDLSFVKWHILLVCHVMCKSFEYLSFGWTRPLVSSSISFLLYNRCTIFHLSFNDLSFNDCMKIFNFSQANIQSVFLLS